MSTSKSFDVQEVGLLQLQKVPTSSLMAGQVGYIISGIKEVRDTKVGDTITLSSHPAPEPLSGYREPKAMVFSGLFPAVAEDYSELKTSLENFQIRIFSKSINFLVPSC